MSRSHKKHLFATSYRSHRLSGRKAMKALRCKARSLLTTRYHYDDLLLPVKQEAAWHSAGAWYESFGIWQRIVNFRSYEGTYLDYYLQVLRK